MSFISIWSKTTDLNKIEKNILQEDFSWSKSFKKSLEKLDTYEAWELIKRTLPGLDKTKARDLVRILFSDKLAFLSDKTKVREERLLAIECLSYLPSRNTVELLVELLKHKEAEVQMYAAGALKNHTPRLVVPCLIQALLEKTIIPARLCEILISMGYLAEEKLVEIYPQTVDIEVQAQIIEILASSRNPKVTMLIRKALKGEQKELKYKAIEAVAEMELRDLWEEVALSLTSNDWRIKNKALQVLSQFKIKEAVKYIEPLLADDDCFIKEYARDCLHELKEI